jgi:hypothetical protein
VGLSGRRYILVVYCESRKALPPRELSGRHAFDDGRRRSLRALRVRCATRFLDPAGLSPDRAKFLDESLPGRRQTASQIAAFNNRREAQWGVSPRDRQAILAAFQARPFVMLKAA